MTTDLEPPAAADTSEPSPAAEAAALPVYKAGEAPEHLRTATQLRADRLKPAPAQEPVAELRTWRRGVGWGTYPLYDPAGAVKMRPLSTKQQAAKTARRTCPQCREIRGYIVYQRCQECRRKASEEAEERRGRTCASCGRVSAAPLRWTGHGVPAAPRCEPCWFVVALKAQVREEEAARWRRSCPECGAQTATDDEAAAALAETGSWTPRCCAPCAVVREERRAAYEQQAREAAENAREARRRQAEDLTAWARGCLDDDQVVILDTETTGLHDDARIVEITVITGRGDVLLDTLVNPGEPIGEATDIHGIADAMVADAPAFSEILPRLTEVLDGRRCLIYNAPYDKGRLRHELTLHHRAAGHPAPEQAAADWMGAHAFEDVMIPYSDWVGDWNDYWGNYSWQPLNGGHRALGDCRAVVERLREMAEGRGFEFPEGGDGPWARSPSAAPEPSPGGEVRG